MSFILIILDPNQFHKIILSMSATTPVKILPSTLTKSNRSHKSINQGRNFSNPSYHTSLDLANAYSGY